MADREQWQVDLKKKASEAASEDALTEVLGGFNTQLQTLASNAGISMTPVSLTDAIERAKSEIIANLPTELEQLANINESIDRFNTNLALSEMWGTDTQSALAGLSTDFRNEMGDFQKQMVVYGNAKMLEQYQKLMSDLLEQIERQNKAIEQQTEMAALGAGFIRSGNAYIKQSKLVSSAVGMVEAYQWYDGKAAFDGFLSSIGDGYGGALLRDNNGEMVEKSRNDIMSDLPAFLEDADTVQVESFFSVQKLILQAAFEKIMGTGTVSERKNSKDKKIIGELAWWIGKPAGSSELVSQVEQAAPHLGAEEQKKLGMDGSITAIDGFKYLADPGFGELGSGGNRPSSIYLGFYNKLDLVSRYVDGKDSDRMERMAGSIDPISATMNQFNPVSMVATAMQNVRVASEVYGTNEGYMAEAQLLSAAKPIISLAGKFLSVAGAALIMTGAGAPLGAGLMALGAGLSYLSDSIKVDAKTGQRVVQGSERGAANALIQTGTAFIPGSFTKDVIVSAVTSGIEYDEKGRITGRFDDDAALRGGVMAGVSSYAGSEFGGYLGGGQTGSFLASEIASTTLNTGIEYYNYSNGYKNNYAAIASPGLDRLGSLAGGLLNAMLGDARAAEAKKIAGDGAAAGKTPEQIRDEMIKNGLYSEANNYMKNVEGLRAADRARRNGEHEQAVQILLGLGYRREDIEQSIAEKDFLESIADGSSDASALRLRTSALRDRRLGASTSKTMGTAENLLTEMKAKAREITGGTRGLTNDELLALAKEYKIDPKYLFDDQTNATMKYFAGKNFSGDYQARVAMEDAIYNGSTAGAGGNWNYFAGGGGTYGGAGAGGIFVGPLRLRTAQYLQGRQGSQGGLPVSPKAPRFSLGPVNMDFIDRLYDEAGKQWQGAKNSLQEYIDRRMGGYKSTSVLGYRLEATHFVGAAHGGGIALYYNGEKYDGSLRSMFVDMYDWSFYAYSSDQRGLKYEASIEAAMYPGIGSQRELEGARMYSMSEDLILGYSSYTIENASQPSATLGHGISVGPGFGASYASPDWNYTEDDFSKDFNNHGGYPPIPPVYFTAWLAGKSDNTLKTYKWEDLW